METAPTPAEVYALLGVTPTASQTSQCEAVLTAVNAYVAQYTRGVGVDGVLMDGALRAVVTTAAARWVKNPTGETTVQETSGPFQRQVTNTAPVNFTSLEWRILDTFRVRTNRPKG